jgi:hypothetical protein
VVTHGKLPFRTRFKFGRQRLKFKIVQSLAGPQPAVFSPPSSFTRFASALTGSSADAYLSF